MASSKAIAALMHEHEVILRVVGGLEQLGAALRDHRQVEPSTLREAAGFMREFADRCHHAKEEELLFPTLVAAGLPEQNGPVAVMKAEHQQARDCIATLVGAIDDYQRGDPAARDRLVAAIDCVGALYPQHIAKEHNVLFPLAERLLAPAALADLVVRFDAAEAALGDDTHHHWCAVAERLASVTPSGTATRAT